MNDKRLTILANNLRAERSRKNISQEKLAELADISRASVSLIERSEQTPSIFIVCDIAKALNIDIEVLLNGI